MNQRERMDAYRKGGIRAYCGNNKWLIENAKAVGNW